MRASMKPLACGMCSKPLKLLSNGVYSCATADCPGIGRWDAAIVDFCIAFETARLFQFDPVITKAVAAHNEAVYITLETLRLLPLKCTPIRVDGRRLLHMVGEGYIGNGVFAVRAAGAAE